MEHLLDGRVGEQRRERFEVQRRGVDQLDVVAADPDLHDAQRGHERPLPDELGVERDDLGGAGTVDEGDEGSSRIDHSRKKEKRGMTWSGRHEARRTIHEPRGIARTASTAAVSSS